MPGKEIAARTAPSTSVNLSLLKSHKSLPKRRIASPDTGLVRAPTSRKPKSDLEREGYSSSERIRSWIPEPSSAQAIPDPTLPLTPPLNASERVNGLNGNRTSTITATSGTSTPIMQQSPPTPETTPPELDQYTHLARGSSPSHLPSTRNESFETARETQFSDGDTRLPESPSLRPSRQQWLKDAGHHMPRIIGLGLGLEQDDGGRTPTRVIPKSSPDSQDVISFNGAWNGATPEIEAVKGGTELAYRSELKKGQTKRSRISDQLLETPPVIETITPSPVAHSLSLRQRVDRARKTPPRALADGFAEVTPWPLRDCSPTLEEKLREVDEKRISQISSTSTVVEAMVYNTPPQRRKTLRHSSKCADLTSATTQCTNRSLNPNNRNQQRLLGHSKFPDGGQRASYASGSGGGGEDEITLSRPRQDVVPPPSRPTTAPEDAVGYFDVPQSQRRIVSAYVSTSSPKHDCRTTTLKMQPTNAPPDDSSFVHTSATSNTSAGIDSISPPTRQQSQLGYQFNETPNATVISPDEESNGDWSALRPRSSLVTPFSLRSARSSTPGTLEVNEATAISIYPHTNKSILVVQHASRRDSRPAEHSAIIASNAKFAIPAGSVQPPVIHQPRQLLDSPLQNPRSPPNPPDFKIIPPTPANAREIPSPDGQEQPPAVQQAPKRRLSNRVKRALSTHRYSEVIVTPLKRSFSLSSGRNNVRSSARRASTGIDTERNLHPFWRPRAFWDNGSDSDSDFGNEGPLVGNSLGMPTGEVKTFDPPRRRPSLTQRLGSLRLPRRRRRSPSAQPASAGGVNGQGPPVRRSSTLRGRKFYRGSTYHDNASYEFIQRPQQHAPPTNHDDGGAAAGEEGTHHGVPRLGYQVQFVGFKGLAEKVKERREKARREKVRERLRGSIDVLRGV
ncbi:MAG: hypothetical protein Q9182_000244 [Xanthomendoza sp. 2 TL-2023]